MNRIAIALLASACSQAVQASVAVYVGKNLTKDGSVLLAGYGDEPSSHWLVIVPRRQHPAGTMITVGGAAAARLPGQLMQIPQAAHTHRYISMDYSYFAGFPAPITNGGMNEYGLAVRDVALNSRNELVDMTPKDQKGVNYSDVARIVLERAKTAREAVDLAIDLVKRHGDFTYGGNSHIFADPNEGWVFLTFAGAKGLWVAKRLGPNDVWLNWRGYTATGYVQELPENWKTNPDYLASDNFVSFATQQGWYKPGSGPFNVIRAYCRDRSGEGSGPEARQVEAAVRAVAPKADVKVLMDQMHITGRDSSGYGQVAHLRAGIHSDLRTLWVAPGPGITAAFVPWRIGVESVPEEYRRHRYITAGEAEKPISKADQGVEGTRYANRAVKRLLYLVDEHRGQFLPEVSAVLGAWDDRQIAAQPGIERTAEILLNAGEDALARRYLTEQAHAAAGGGLRLIEALAAGIEARTRVLHGIRPAESPGGR
ncbi:MAG: peptidase U34 [Acidobacteria bacterium]|nr:peptidase U34 [Acidobacteriota bacterium]